MGSSRMSMGSKAVVGVALGGLFLVGACQKKKDARPLAPECPTCVTADERGFHPSSVTVAKGGPGQTVELMFTRVTEETCAKDVVFPELGIKEPLPLGKNVTVQVPTDTAKTFTFQCGMGMYKSSLVVAVKR